MGGVKTVKDRAIGGFIFIILAVVMVYVVAYMVPGAVSDYYDQMALLENNTNVTAWMLALLDLALIGLPIAILIVFIGGAIYQLDIF